MTAMLEQLKEIYEAVSEGKEAALTFTVDREAYYRNFHRPERLILLGCGHIGQALCRYAADLGFAVTAVDERPSFANHTLMPDAAEIVCSDFPDAIRRLQVTERDYVCVITRGHRYDADCLRALLPGQYPKYLGMIGSGALRSVTIDMSNDIAEEEGMVCGGEMKVLIADVSP